MSPRPARLSGTMAAMTDPPGAAVSRRPNVWRAMAVVYWVGVCELCFLIAAAPGFAGLLLLERSPGNLPLYALCLAPVAPAFSAMISALRARPGADDLAVWPRYWRAWVRNVVDVLWVWVPALVAATVLATTLAFGAIVGVDAFFTGAAVVLLVVLAVWSTHALIIASLFRFRARDLARLALYYLAAKPLVSLGALSFLVLAAAVVVVASDAAAAAAAVLFAAGLLANARPLIADVSARFVSPDAVASATDATPPGPQ
jgi:hypothetical protein